MRIHFFKLQRDGMLPTFGHDNTDAGMDLYAREAIQLAPGEQATVSTGIGWSPRRSLFRKIELEIRPRSGITKNGIVAMIGTIDQSYRGVIYVTMKNFSDKPYAIEVGQRIAQAVVKFLPIVKPVWTKIPSKTKRGESGFGSTGI